MCPRVLSHLFLSVCVCATDVWSRFLLTTFTFLSADVGKTIDLVACWRLTFTDCNQTYFSCQFWPHSLYSWWFWWFSQLFQWFLRLKRTIHTIWSGWARELELENFSVKIPSKPRNKTRMKQNKQQQMYFYASLRQLTQFDLEWDRRRKNRSAQLLYPNRKETVR